MAVSSKRAGGVRAATGIKPTTGIRPTATVQSKPRVTGTGSVDKNTIFRSNLSNTELERRIDNSMRLFGIPHQFIEHNDPRIGTKSNLGRCFAERIIMEAPIVCFKPGVSDFLPGKSESEKKNQVSRIMEAVNNNGSLKSIFGKLDKDYGSNDDTELYYGHKSDYSGMMAKVNILCKLMAVFLGIGDVKVPWAKGGATFATYDWRYYTMKSQYDDVNFKNRAGSGSVGAFIKNSLSAAGQSLMNDTEWVRFYVDSSSSYGESNSNSTTSSILESYTEKLEGMAKELDVISGLSGVDVSELAESSASSVDSYIQEHATGDGAIATMLSRISGAGKQIISGGNFLIPEIWSQSEYSKSYSFSITLSTPYGCPEAWFLNVGVPLMHILGLALPQQLSANTYKAPYLVKCYSPGWFNCNLGIIDSLSIEKGSDASWNVGGLPNEVKVSISVRDLYATLSIPVEPYNKPSVFLSTGMLEFLMVNCGVDITKQNMEDRFKVWATILANNFTDRFTSKPYDVQQFFKEKIQGLFKLI